MEQTSAHALHTLVVRARDSNKNTLTRAWAASLEADPDSPDLARRLAECSALLVDLGSAIDSLPDGTARTYERYLYQWYVMVQQPNLAWNQEMNVAAQFSQANLDILRASGDVIAATFPGTSAHPSTTDLDTLARVCKDWIEELSTVPSGLPESLRRGLVNQLHQVIWLIDNAEIFGSARVARAMEHAVGIAAPLAFTITSKDARDRFIVRVGAAMAAILAFCGTATATAESLQLTFDATRHAIESGQELVGTMVDIAAPDDEEGQPSDK
jgi:hypothetical protein